MSAGRSHEFYT
jgi:hypothetical protein